MTGSPAPAHRSGFTRRRALTTALGAGAAVLGTGALSGCGSALASDDSTVRLWDLFQGADGGLLNDMVSAARPDMPGTKIERTVLEWGTPYYTKLAMASAGGRGPDVAATHLSRLAGYAPTGLIDPWDLDLLAEFGVRKSDFAEAVWSRTLFEGKTYAIPLDTHPFIVFFDPKPTKKAGLLKADGTLDTDAFSSPDRFLDAGRELAKATGKQGIAYGYVNDTAQGWRLFFGLYRQTGGTFKLPEGGPAEVDLDRMTEVIAFMTKLTDGKVNPKGLNYESAVAAFANKQTAMILNGEWELNTFKEANKDVSAAPFPTVFGTPAVYADAHSFVLPHRDNPDPEHRRRTHQAVAALLKAGQIWATAGHIPAYEPITRTKKYADLLPQAHYKAAAEDVVLDPAAWFVGAGSDFQNSVSQVLQQALLNGLAPDRAARAMVRRINTFLSKPSPA
ncbi:maltose ABC transporter periplasmic protein [Streptomyces sp. YIM 130001]|uniref:ABC transporter substrate-binding protein n=1 Tax=Streptomyces sp. YIM 130001 TaxID=2259644 RepID=UPI000E657982|nr:extracellular solute-binding protein [Streptomyces sp. YIM 130001]RII20421.1 maltose ABC transporter periplasmic protein [Streptomyces sp. YIM 130001]